MIRSALAATLALAASPAAAFDICDEMWFIRNLQFDRAGYCFGSALGQAVFDNSDCTGKDVALSAEARRNVDDIKNQEGWMGCSVDTSTRSLDLPHAGMLRALSDLPVPIDAASGCMGWQGDEVPLHAGHDARSPVVAVARAGQDILWEYDWNGPEGWEFISVHYEGRLIGMGWSESPIDTGFCSQLAG